MHAQTANPSNNTLDFVIPGGADISVTKSIPIRPVQFDFVLIHFGNSFTKATRTKAISAIRVDLFLGSRSKI